MIRKHNAFGYICLIFAFIALAFSMVVMCAADIKGITKSEAMQQTEPEPEPVEESTQPGCDFTNYSYMPIEYNFVLDIEEKYKVYNPDELTPEILEHRAEGDTLIIERIIGKVINKSTGDGRIINTSDTYYNYISYKCVNFNIEDGTEILTYLIYNPDNNYIDDVERFDFVFNREGED